MITGAVGSSRTGRHGANMPSIRASLFPEQRLRDEGQPLHWGLANLTLDLDWPRKSWVALGHHCSSSDFHFLCCKMTRVTVKFQSFPIFPEDENPLECLLKIYISRPQPKFGLSRRDSWSSVFNKCSGTLLSLGKHRAT